MITTNYMPVTESYFGKSKYLLEAEKVIDIIIKRFTVPFKDVGKRIIDATKVNTSKENKRLEALFCKQFGFKEMVLHWSGSDDVNAFTGTYGIMTLFDNSKPGLPVENNDGSYYDSKHIYICAVNVYAGLIDASLNAEEILAIILHEIGHNFTCTPLVHMVTVLDWALIPVNMYMAVKNSFKIMNKYDEIKALKAKGGTSDINEAKAIGAEFGKLVAICGYRWFKYFNLSLSGIERVLSLAYGSIPEQMKDWFKSIDKSIDTNKNRILAEWDAVVSQVEKAKAKFEANPNILGTRIIRNATFDLAATIFGGSFFVFQKLIDVQAGYSNEVFADSFATTYGYGSASVSAHRKMSFYMLKNHLFDKRNKYNTYNQYMYLMAMLMYQFIDEHPGDQTRMRKQIDKMRTELSNPNIDPRMRKVLEADLARAEKIYNEYINNFPPELKHLAVIMNYNQLNEMYFGGKLDIREPINRVLNAGKTEA